MSESETCNIKFGKLNITMNSVNTVPSATAYYEQMSTMSASTCERQKKRAKNAGCTVPKETVRERVMVSNAEIANENMKQASQPCRAGGVFSSSSSTEQTKDRGSETMRRDIKCWWCRVSEIDFEGSCFLPTRHDDLRKRYEGYGFFCSWECVKAFNFDARDVKTSFRRYLIGQLCRLLYGPQRSREIRYAPHWSDCVSYGGNVTDEKYAASFSKTTLPLSGKKRTDILRHST